MMPFPTLRGNPPGRFFVPIWRRRSNPHSVFTPSVRAQTRRTKMEGTKAGPDRPRVEAQTTLDLHIADPVSLLNEIARRYESTERILMEFVDNALDDAETLYQANAEAYPQQVSIEVELD